MSSILSKVLFIQPISLVRGEVIPKLSSVISAIKFLRHAKNLGYSFEYYSIYSYGNGTILLCCGNRVSINIGKGAMTCCVVLDDGSFKSRAFYLSEYEDLCKFIVE